MLISKARDYIYKCSTHPAALTSIQNQVPSSSPLNISTLTPTPHLPSFLSQNIKLFSNSSFGSFVSKQKLFDEMPDRSNRQLVGFETMLSVLQSSLENGSLESSLNNMNLSLNVEFMIRVFKAPSVPRENLINFLKWAMSNSKSDFSSDSRVLNDLGNAIGTRLKLKDILSLWEFVKDIEEKKKCVLGTNALNLIILLFWKMGRGEPGLEVFNKFEDFGCDPNADSYYLTIEALYRNEMYDDAWSVCQKMLDAGKFPDYKKTGNIIACFCKGKKAKQAHLVYQMAKKNNVRPPAAFTKILLHGLRKENDTVKLAVDLLDDLRGDARKYAIKLFSTVLSGLSRIKDIEQSQKLLFKMIYEGPPPGNTEFNLVISQFSKAGRMDEVMDLVDVMEIRGLRPDVYTYCVIMSGYTKRGQMEEARRILEDAKKNHSKLTPVAYHILAQGYYKLKEFDKALEMLNEMKDTGVKTDADEYYKMIQSQCLEALDQRTAEKLLEETKENGLQLNGTTVGLTMAVKELEEDELDPTSS